jgi:hypothetical protein
MYKEVNRSLIKWPVAASATMLAISWFALDDDVDNVDKPSSSQVSHLPDLAVILEVEVTPVLPEQELLLQAEPIDEVAVEQVARDERAMKLPPQIADAFAGVVDQVETPARKSKEKHADTSVVEVVKPVIKAPVRMVEQELAGLDRAGLRAPSDQSEIESAHDDRQSRASTDAIDTAAEMVTLAQCERFEWVSPAWMVDPWSSGFWRPESELDKMVNEQTKSILPDSNRALGRRDLMASEVQDTISRPSWSGASQAVISRIHVVKNCCHGWLVTLARQSDRLKKFVAEQELASVVAKPEVVQPKSVVVPVAGVIESEGDHAIPQVQQSVSRKVSDHPVVSVERLPVWPEAKQLEKQLSELSEGAQSQPAFRFISVDGSELTIVDWASRVQSQLASLHALPRLGDEAAGRIMDRLNGLALEGRQQAELIEDRQQQVHWLRASYAISRRTAVWMPVWDLSQHDDVLRDINDAEATGSLETVVEQVRNDLIATGDVAGWNTFLMLDEIMEHGRGDNLAARALLAQRLMSRVEWHSLGKEQSEWLQRASIEGLVAVIRPWAHTNIDYAELLSQLERQESNAIDLAAVEIASAAQTLRFAESPAAVKVSDEINTHYRNANVRFAISERFIERMIPAIESTSMPVNTEVMGARVSGVSQIQSDFEIDLEPAVDRWLIKLKANGRVETDSVGRQGVVAVRTAASAKFNAASQIEVTKRGLSLGDANAKVRSSTRLRGVETSYDGWPLVGMLVRSIAEDRYREMAPQANRIANREARTRIESEIDEQLETRVDEAAVKVSEMVLGPLGRLQLDPRVTDMRTTDQRLMARYRVAGDWQLGAFTPRPRALSDSLMSVQLHQSALNNTLEQLISADQPIDIRTLIRKSAGTFGKQDVVIPDDIPDDVTVQFARTRPITVEIQDGMLWLTVRVLRLRREEGIDLTQFIVRAGYRPEIEGMNARLVRDGHLRISGPRMAMRERLPVRAIFNKVFAASREIPLTVPRLIENPATEGLVVSQLELRDGWLAMAISEEGAARIALRQE